MDAAEKRGLLIAQLETALVLADEFNDGHTGFLIERALDEARAQQFKPFTYRLASARLPESIAS
jgi:hypothetical protein